jgi:hypothetical protein
MERKVKFSGVIKRSSDIKIARTKAYNNWKHDWLKYNEFEKIDFVDDEGREYKFNVKKKSNLSSSEYNDPPTFLSSKSEMSRSDPDEIRQFGKISFSVRLPTRKDGNSKLKFPESNGKGIYLYNVNTGAVCTGSVYEVNYGQRTKTGKVGLKNFELIGRVNDDVQFMNIVKKTKM